MLRLITTLTILAAAPPLYAQQTTAADRAGIEAFNRALDSATRKMDNAASIALWEEDGVSLMPSTAPIVGKTAIAKFFEEATAPLKNAKMDIFELKCFDIVVSGPMATEWCTDHQVVTFTDGQPKFDGHGKMAFVLHRGNDGKWRIKQEMWNQGVAPPAAR